MWSGRCRPSISVRRRRRTTPPPRHDPESYIKGRTRLDETSASGPGEDQQAGTDQNPSWSGCRNSTSRHEPINNGDEELRLVPNRAALLVCLAATSAFAGEPANIDDHIRGGTHFNMSLRAGAGCFGVLCPARPAVPGDAQDFIRLNRDTPCSQGVFDLTPPLTVTMPDPVDRFPSIIGVNQDHSIRKVSCGAATVTLCKRTWARATHPSV